MSEEMWKCHRTHVNSTWRPRDGSLLGFSCSVSWLCWQVHGPTQAIKLHETKYTHKWVHVNYWSMNGVTGLCACQFPECELWHCDIVLQFFERWPLGETWWRMYLLLFFTICILLYNYLKIKIINFKITFIHTCKLLIWSYIIIENCSVWRNSKCIKTYILK